MVMGPLVLLRQEQESPPQVPELCWLLHKQLLILHTLVFHTLVFHTLVFHRPVFHRLELRTLVHSILVRKDHTLASDSSA